VDDGSARVARHSRSVRGADLRADRDRRSGVVGEPFRGTINVDIRDSVPDWAPFEPPKALPGAPSVVFIVLGRGSRPVGGHT
jgi:hypothetical protein